MSERVKRKTVTARTARLRFVAVACMLAVGSACAANAPQDVTKPEGPIARQLDNLARPVFAIAAVFFFLVQGLVLYVAIRFRRRSEDDAPPQIHGHTALEITWTAIPAMILLVVGVLTVSNIIDINRVREGPDVLEVEVIGHQWWWEYRYPGKDVVTANELHVPVGTRVELAMTSDDVIHSFWPPKLAGKVDVIPGRVNHMALQADEPGTYLGQCVEFCGLSHSRMRLRVVAHEPDDFERWLQASARPAAPPPATSEAAEGLELFNSRGCGGCHTVEGVSEGKIGPNLTHLHLRKTFGGAIYEMTPNNLRHWLRDPQKAKAGNKMVLPLKLTEEEITKLIAYLETLK